MQLIQPTARGWARSGHRSRRLSGTTEDVLARLDVLKAKYGNGYIGSSGAAVGGEEMNDVMGLVAPYLKGDSWQWCTIVAWLNGTPSEDDVDWKAEYFSDQPLLEDTCGDHTTFGSQYDEAFDDLKSAGCPQEAITWIRAKGQANFDFKRKGKKAEEEGARRFELAKQAAKDAVNPLKPTSPFFWALLAAGAVLILKYKK